MPAAFDLDLLHRRCFANRARLARAVHAGCFSCLQRFPAAEVTEFTDARQTALCPRCGIDAVLADEQAPPVDDALLRALHEAYFQVEAPRQ